jgi:adenylate cyclase
MIEAVETATGFILFAVLAVALYHQWRRGKSLQAQLAAAEAALEQLQRACSRLAPAGVVQRLVADGIQSNAGLVAERKVATAMFVDLVGFSAMSERLDPELLLRVINGYYQRMSDAIDEHRGQVGSFVGDGIVAYFGAIQPNPWECDDAVRAALAMRAAIREYNVELEHEGLPPISIGIGIDREWIHEKSAWIGHFSGRRAGSASREYRGRKRSGSCRVRGMPWRERGKRERCPA